MKKIIHLTHKTTNDPAELQRITDFVFAIATAYDCDVLGADEAHGQYVLKVSKELCVECTSEVEAQNFKVVTITTEKAKSLTEHWPPLPRRRVVPSETEDQQLNIP
jgi:hypothetical protein